MGDKLLFNFGAKFKCKFIIAHVKLRDFRGNVPYVSVLR